MKKIIPLSVSVIIVCLLLLPSCTDYNTKIIGTWKIKELTVNDIEPADFKDWEYNWIFYSRYDYKKNIINTGDGTNTYGDGTTYTEIGEYSIDSDYLILSEYSTITVITTNTTLTNAFYTNIVYADKDNTNTLQYIYKFLTFRKLEIETDINSTNYYYLLVRSDL